MINSNIKQDLGIREREEFFKGWLKLSQRENLTKKKKQVLPEDIGMCKWESPRFCIKNWFLPFSNFYIDLRASVLEEIILLNYSIHIDNCIKHKFTAQRVITKQIHIHNPHLYQETEHDQPPEALPEPLSTHYFLFHRREIHPNC